MTSLIIANTAQIVTPLSPSQPQRGHQMRKVHIWKNGCIALDSKTRKIISIGNWKDIKSPNAQILEAKNSIVFPGFVDSHTHPLYAGSRIKEFTLRSLGVPYMKILAHGGGILSTVNATKKADDFMLYSQAQNLFNQMISHGTTTLEAKTGYGLSTAEEIRHLKILQKLKNHSCLELFITFLGAHAIPKKYKKDPDAYVNLVINNMLPQVAKFKLADFCDVFCEENVFSLKQTKLILLKAKKLGLKLRLHADEFKSIGATDLGVLLQASSVDHLMAISSHSIKKLAQSKTAAVLLPCTSFFLGKNHYAPARQLIDAGTVVALATDFNAGSNLCFSMQMACSLGVLQMKMTPEEALVASTLHGAYALGVSNRIGSLHPGKQGDLIILEGKDYREFFYKFGTNQVKSVIKYGRVVI